jgi:hypothetical protein
VTGRATLCSTGGASLWAQLRMELLAKAPGELDWVTRLLDGGEGFVQRAAFGAHDTSRACVRPLLHRDVLLYSSLAAQRVAGSAALCVPTGVPRRVLGSASRMAGAGGVRRRAAQRQSRELPAVCTARCVSSASSPTMRRTMHRNSVARPRRPKPRVGSRSSCEILHRRRRVESAGPPTG